MCVEMGRTHNYEPSLVQLGAGSFVGAPARREGPAGEGGVFL